MKAFRMLLICFLINSIIFFLLTAVTKAQAATNGSTARIIKIFNQSGSRVEVYWVHPTTLERTLTSFPDVLNGATFSVNTYVGHQFEIREVPSKTTLSCQSEDQRCRSGYFTVSENDEQRKFLLVSTPRNTTGLQRKRKE